MQAGHGGTPLALFLWRISAIWGLSEADRQSLAAIAGAVQEIPSGELIVERDSEVSALSVLCGGVAQSYRTLPDDTKQIATIFVPGDILGGGSLIFRRSRISVRALTPSLVASFPLSRLRSLMEKSPAIARAIWGEVAAQAVLEQERTAQLSRQKAYARVANFLCELSFRFQAAGLYGDAVLSFPLTQSELGDALWLSTVHVNRVLQRLQGEKLIALGRGQLKILDRDGLNKTAEFDPSYLVADQVSMQRG